MANTAYETIESLPDISFIDWLTLEDVQSLAIGFYEKYLDELEDDDGGYYESAKTDPYRLMLLACAQVIYQGLLRVDKSGKMNFLKYVYGDYLDNYASGKGITRKGAQAATVDVKFSLAAAREAATPIPEGTRVSSDLKTYFTTTRYAEIPAGDTDITLTLSCTDEGVEGNGILAGEITTLVDSVPFISAVTNTTASAGGEDIEDDKSFKERAYLATSAYSVAGPEDAYMYWVHDASSLIGDVMVSTTDDAEVSVQFILKDGTLPDAALIAHVADHLSQKKIRPLTDHVIVSAPDTVSFSVDVTIYISLKDSVAAGTIQDAAYAALEDYASWQQKTIGQDINPDEIIFRLKAAGVKRAVVTAPVFTPVSADEIAHLSGSISMTYGGIESD